MRACWSLSLLAPLFACSPGTGVQSVDVDVDGGDSGSATDDPGDSEGAVPDDLESSDSGGPGGSGGCKHEGPLAILDLCQPEDPCDDVVCEACVGGLCVEPIPADLCEGVVLTELGIVLPEALGTTWVDVDGQPGDELISTSASMTQTGWSVRTYVDGVEVVSDEVHAPGAPSILLPLRFDDDGIADLLVAEDSYVAGYVHVLIGDGEGGFTLAPQQFANIAPLSPVVVDFDGDGADDLFAYSNNSLRSMAYRNVGGGFELVETFDVNGLQGSAADIDGDGAVDDVLLGNYPSPDVLLGDELGLSYAEALPSAQLGPELDYELGRPIAADLDGDGWIDVLSLIGDSFGRMGVRLWAGIGPGQFAAPVDQMLIDPAWASSWVIELVGVAELDGVGPPELLFTIDDELVFARLELGSGPPLTCLGSLLEDLDVDDRGPPSVGDLDADGWPELAIQRGDLRVYTTLP